MVKILLKDQFEAAKKKNGFPNRPRNLKKFKNAETGFIRTRRVRCKGCTQGFMYRYRWFDVDRNKHRVLSSVDFQQLKKRVKKQGLDWYVEDLLKARKTAKEVGLPLRDLQ